MNNDQPFYLLPLHPIFRFLRIISYIYNRASKNDY